MVSLQFNIQYSCLLAWTCRCICRIEEYTEHTRTQEYTRYTWLFPHQPWIWLPELACVEKGFSIINESGLIALLGPSLEHSLGSLLSLLLLPSLHGLDHGYLFGLLFLVPRLKQQSGVKRRRGDGGDAIKMISCCVLLFGFVPVFDYPLYDGVCGEAVPAVHSPQDSSPPRLLHINKTAPNENDSDYSNASGWVGWGGGFLQHTGQICPCPGIFLSSRDIQDPPVDKKTHFCLIEFNGKCSLAGFREFRLLWNGPVNL